jgi:lipopolysaccharide biosynthesis regulator YciM
MKGPFVTALLAFCLGGTVCYSQVFSDGQNPFGRRTGLSERNSISSVSGTVVGSDGAPVGDVRVEIRNQQTGATVASGYTNSGGAFEFDNLPSASYDLVATHGLSESHQQVLLTDMSSNVKIRVDTANSAAAQADGHATVSVAEYKVPQKARDAFHKAQAALVKNNREEVEKQLAKSLQICPDYAPALTLRGVLALDHAKTQPAIEDFDHAIHADPNFSMAYTGMAAALNTLQKFDEALRSADRAITLAPTAWQPHFEMAKAYIGKSDYQNALQQITKAQQFCAVNYAPIHLVRADVMLVLKDYNDAVTELQAFLTMAPNDANSPAAREALERAKKLTASTTQAAR